MEDISTPKSMLEVVTSTLESVELLKSEVNSMFTKYVELNLKHKSLQLRHEELEAEYKTLRQQRHGEQEAQEEALGELDPGRELSRVRKVRDDALQEPHKESHPRLQRCKRKLVDHYDEEEECATPKSPPLPPEKPKSNRRGRRAFAPEQQHPHLPIGNRDDSTLEQQQLSPAIGSNDEAALKLQLFSPDFERSEGFDTEAALQLLLNFGNDEGSDVDEQELSRDLGSHENAALERRHVPPNRGNSEACVMQEQEATPQNAPSALTRKSVNDREKVVVPGSMSGVSNSPSPAKKRSAAFLAKTSKLDPVRNDDSTTGQLTPPASRGQSKVHNSRGSSTIAQKPIPRNGKRNIRPHNQQPVKKNAPELECRSTDPRSDAVYSRLQKAIENTTASVRHFSNHIVDRLREKLNLEFVVTRLHPNLYFSRREDTDYAVKADINQALFEGFERESFRKSDDKFGEFCERKFSLLCDRALQLRVRWLSTTESTISSRCLLEYLGGPLLVFHFISAARSVWRLHKLACAFSRDRPASIFRVEKGAELDVQYMDVVVDLHGDPQFLPKTGFMVTPGFILGQTIIRSQIYPAGIPTGSAE